MQRREFVRNIAASAAVLMTVPASRLLLSKRPGFTVGSEGWSGAAFASLRGESFRVHGPGGIQLMTLDDVSHHQDGGMESASLRFRGDASRRLPQECYEFEHAGLRRRPILIVPGTSSGGSCFYRAIFTRFV